MQQWYVRTSGGQTLGPMSDRDIVSALQWGHIDAHSAVGAAGGTQWVPLFQHPAIAPMLSGLNLPPSGNGAPLSTEREPVTAGQIAGLVVLVGGVIGLVLLTRDPFRMLLAAGGISIYLDARNNGVRRMPSQSGLTNMSPITWAIGATFFPMIIATAYFAVRSSKRTRPGGALFAVIAAVSFIAFVAVWQLHRMHPQ